MRLFQFAKWWWDRNDNFNRTVIPTLLFWVIPCGISVIWLGHLGALMLVSGLLAVAVGWFIAGVIYMLRCMWDQFERELPPEDVQIINRLKGVQPSSDET